MCNIDKVQYCHSEFSKSCNRNSETFFLLPSLIGVPILRGFLRVFFIIEMKMIRMTWDLKKSHVAILPLDFKLILQTIFP